VLLESIACGTPFVASDVGGVAEIADPGADRLTPAGDVSALAAAIVEQLSRPSAGPRRFLPESWERSAAALEVVLRGTIASRGDRAGH